MNTKDSVPRRRKDKIKDEESDTCEKSRYDTDL